MTLCLSLSSVSDQVLVGDIELGRAWTDCPVQQGIHPALRNNMDMLYLRGNTAQGFNLMIQYLVLLLQPYLGFSLVSHVSVTPGQTENISVFHLHLFGLIEVA